MKNGIHWKGIALEALGCLLSAFGICNFAVAAYVPVTGVAGIGAILYHLFGVPIGLCSVVLNLPIAAICYRLLGRGFFVRSVRCILFYALYADVLLPLLPTYQGDRLLAALCGGVISGIGDALIYMQNSSTGGIDFVTMAIKTKHPHLPFGNLTFGAAVAVIALHGLVFRDVDAVIYGLLLNFVVAAIINRMMFGFNSGMVALIVTDDGPAVCAEIDRVADRGSTILKGRGGWGGAEKDVVLCACGDKQLYAIEKAVKKLDPASFIIMMRSNEVEGEGFHRLELGGERREP